MASVAFFGEDFGLAGEMSEFALLEFAEAAADGEDGDSMQGMAAILRLLRDCITPEDWPRFRKVARSNRAKSSDLLPVIQATMTAVAERPTGLPSDSSDGPVVIELKSEPSVDEKVWAIAGGRVDKYSMLMNAREFQDV